MAIQSKCHCGATQLTISKAPECLTECNCTFCSKQGVLWAYYDVGDVSLEKVNNTHTYSSNPEDHQHHFCLNCGCLSYNYQSQSWNEDGSRGSPKISVNARLLENFDIKTVPIKRLDGLNQW